MARRPSKHTRPARPLSGSHASVEEHADGRWLVRTVPGSAAVKEYRCPGCSQVIRPGTPHLVAWPAEPAWGADSGLDDRRHWHTGCWSRRR